MAKVQTRKSVSLNRRSYDKLRLAAQVRGISMSQLTEAALEHFYTTYPASEEEHNSLEEKKARKAFTF